MKNPVCPYCENNQYTRVVKIPAVNKKHYYQAVCYGCGAKGPIDDDVKACTYAFNKRLNNESNPLDIGDGVR